MELVIKTKKHNTLSPVELSLEYLSAEDSTIIDNDERKLDFVERINELDILGKNLSSFEQDSEFVDYTEMKLTEDPSGLSIASLAIRNSADYYNDLEDPNKVYGRIHPESGVFDKRLTTIIGRHRQKQPLMFERDDEAISLDAGILKLYLTISVAHAKNPNKVTSPIHLY